MSLLRMCCNYSQRNKVKKSILLSLDKESSRFPSVSHQEKSDAIHQLSSFRWMIKYNGDTLSKPSRVENIVIMSLLTFIHDWFIWNKQQNLTQRVFLLLSRVNAEWSQKKNSKCLSLVSPRSSVKKTRSTLRSKT